MAIKDIMWNLPPSGPGLDSIPVEVSVGKAEIFSISTE